MRKARDIEELNSKPRKRKGDKLALFLENKDYLDSNLSEFPLNVTG